MKCKSDKNEDNVKETVKRIFKKCFVACNFNCFNLIEESMKKRLID